MLRSQANRTAIHERRYCHAGNADFAHCFLPQKRTCDANARFGAFIPQVAGGPWIFCRARPV